MITLRIMLKENQNDSHFSKVYLDTLPSVPRIGEKIELGTERFLIYDVTYNLPMKTISVLSFKVEEV